MAGSSPELSEVEILKPTPLRTWAYMFSAVQPQAPKGLRCLLYEGAEIESQSEPKDNLGLERGV